MNKISKLFKELGFYVIAIVEDYNVEFLIYLIEGIQEDGTILFHKKDSGSWPDPVDNIALSEIYCHGNVKWDGCSNWHFDEQDRIRLHACNKQELLNIGIILSECWNMASELCLNFDGEKN